MGPEASGSVSRGFGRLRASLASELEGLWGCGAVGLWGLSHPPLTMQRETGQRGILLELPLVLCYSRTTGLGIWGVHCLKGQASWEPAPVQPYISPGLPSLLSMGCFLQVTATTLPNPVLLPFYIGTSWYPSLGWVELESSEEWFDLIIRSWVRGLRFILLLPAAWPWVNLSLSLGLSFPFGAKRGLTLFFFFTLFLAGLWWSWLRIKFSPEDHQSAPGTKAALPPCCPSPASMVSLGFSSDSSPPTLLPNSWSSRALSPPGLCPLPKMPFLPTS